MKKIAVFLIVLFWAAICSATVYVPANTRMVYWPEAKAQNGTVIPTNQITYTVWIANAITDPNHTNPVKIITGISVRKYLIALNVEGSYDIGVSATRTVNGRKINESEISWSDVVGSPEPWGLIYYSLIAGPATISANPID